MNLAKFNEESLIKIMDGFSGAEIKAVVTEAGYFAIRNDRTRVKEDDFIQAVEKVKIDVQQENTDYKTMFG